MVIFCRARRPTRYLNFMAKPKRHNIHQGIRNVPMRGHHITKFSGGSPLKARGEDRSADPEVGSLTPMGMMEI